MKICPTDSLSVRRGSRSRAADEVVERFVDLIRAGELRDGERLPAEHRLAETFGVSRSVVREALGGLRGLGVIVSRVGSGSYVSRGEAEPDPILLGRYSASQLHEVRAHLEVPGAGLAAARASAFQRRALQELVEEMGSCSDRLRWARLDADFHVALARAANNQVQVRLVSELQELVTEYSALANATDPGRSALAHAEHRRILDAVLAGDREAAEAAMAHHLGEVAKLLRRAPWRSS